MIKNNVIVNSGDGEHLLLCNLGSCTATASTSASLGYYINTLDNTKYIKCSGDTVVCELETGSASCDSNIGLINASGQLCLDGKSHIAYFKDGDSHNDDLYLVHYDDSSIFASVIKDSSSIFGIVKSESNSFTLNIDDTQKHYCTV